MYYAKRSADDVSTAEGVILTEAIGAPSDLCLHTCEIVSAYVSNNHVARSELPALIVSIGSVLSGLKTGGKIAAEEPLEKSTPTQIRNSITIDALFSFIDGKPYKTLKRHLSTHGFDPNSYRARYGLPVDYPMVAPSYSERRSNISRSFEFGKRKDQQTQTEPPVEPLRPAKRGRPRRS